MIDGKKVMEELSNIRNDIVDGYITEPERAVNTLTDALELLKEQEPKLVKFDEPQYQKPPLGVKPYYVAAWQRIGELIGAIERQYESADGSAELVEKWANEISWQASMIEALRGGQDEQTGCN